MKIKKKAKRFKKKLRRASLYAAVVLSIFSLTLSACMYKDKYSYPKNNPEIAMALQNYVEMCQASKANCVPLMSNEDTFRNLSPKAK